MAKVNGIAITVTSRTAFHGMKRLLLLLSSGLLVCRAVARETTELKPDVLYFEDTAAGRKGAADIAHLYAGRQATAIVTAHLPKMTFPHVIDNPPPFFPEPLRHNAERGSTVVVDFIIGENGQVLYAVAVAASDRRFCDYAVEAVRKWRFSPAMRQGKPVRCHMRVPIVFN